MILSFCAGVLFCLPRADAMMIQDVEMSQLSDTVWYVVTAGAHNCWTNTCACAESFERIGDRTIKASASTRHRPRRRRQQQDHTSTSSPSRSPGSIPGSPSNPCDGASTRTVASAPAAPAPATSAVVPEAESPMQSELAQSAPAPIAAPMQGDTTAPVGPRAVQLSSMFVWQVVQRHGLQRL